MGDRLVKFDRLTEKFVRYLYPPYSWEYVSRLLDVMGTFDDPNKLMETAISFSRVLDKSRQRFEYYSSRLPFPRSWYMFDYSVLNYIYWFPYDFQVAFFEFYEKDGGFDHAYDPESFRAVVYDQYLPGLRYMRGSVRREVADEFSSLRRFIDDAYHRVVEEGKYSEVEKKYGFIDYEFPDVVFRVPHLKVRFGVLLPLLTYFNFYYFPGRDHVPVVFKYVPSVSLGVATMFPLVLDREFNDAFFNAPKSILSTYVNWFLVPFYSISQPVYFDRKGRYVMGWYLDELVYYPNPPAELGKTLFIGVEFMKAFWYLFRLSKLVRYVTYHSGVETYPYPFEHVELVRDHPVASLAYMFLLIHRLAFVDSPTYRAQNMLYWRSAKEILASQGMVEYFSPLKVFSGFQRMFVPRVREVYEYGYENLWKYGGGVYIYPDVASWFVLNQEGD